MHIPQVIQDISFADHDVFDGKEFDTRQQHSNDILELYRGALRQGTARLEALFYDGLSAAELVPARARFVDELVGRAWARFLSSGSTELALLAVGGYGRGELHPGSDIDLLILYGSADQNHTWREEVAAFLTFLWDVGLEVGQSVRTLEECESDAAGEVTIATNLMEARLLQGAQELFDALRQRVGPDTVWPMAAFFKAKRQEQARRHERFHDTAYNLEPNIKEGPGGLRDIQNIGWVAKRHFGASTLHDLVDHGFLTESEYQELNDGQKFLWRVRFALHALTGRREDRLLFDHQSKVATQFGYQNNSRALAIEQFMQRYYSTIMNLCRLNEMLLQHFEEEILMAGEATHIQSINRRFVSRNGYLEVANQQVFRRNPVALLELFLQLAQNPDLKGVRASTIRLVREHRHLIDESIRNDVRATSLFMEIMRQQQGVTRALGPMNAYGVLGVYLPEFGAVVGRMQYDLFHVYTVDQHSLFTVRNLRQLDFPRREQGYLHDPQSMPAVPKLELLYIAGLFHDIAKGRGGDHSHLGAQDAKAFCHRHDLSEFDTGLITWLVEQHLLMSMTAQKQDTHDPRVINAFAEKMGDLLHLNYLYMLTIADIRATNPKLWNSWRASLLRELYEATRRALRRGLEHPIDEALRVREKQTGARKRLARNRIDPQRIEQVWANLGSDYFLRHSEDEIAWHTRAILKKADDGRALVLARQAARGTEVFVYVKDKDNLFATTASIFDKLGLTVVDARIITGNNGYTLDSYVVLEANGEPIADRSRERAIVVAVRRALNQDCPVPVSTQRRTPRRLRHFSFESQVIFCDDGVKDRTVVEIIAADRPGLLCQIGHAFVDCGVRLRNAKIATLGERVEDVFFITDRNNQPLANAEDREALRSSLLRHLDENLAA